MATARSMWSRLIPVLYVAHRVLGLATCRSHMVTRVGSEIHGSVNTALWARSSLLTLCLPPHIGKELDVKIYDLFLCYVVSCRNVRLLFVCLK